MVASIYAVTRDKILGDGYGIPRLEGYFYAEVPIKGNIPQSGVVSKWAYLFSRKEAG